MSRSILTLVLALLALPAEARFGKAGSKSSSSSTSSSGSHGSSSSSTHGAAPVGSRGSSSWASSSPTVEPRVRVSPWALGFYSGYYVPHYGYGYGTWVGAGTTGMAPVGREESTLRVTAGLEGMLFVAGDPGATIGLLANFEGEQFGVALAAQNIAVKNQEGAGYDTLQQVSARLTWAFLTGKYGRLRAELGGDVFFAQSLTVIAPTGGLSGSLWVGGPVALEGSIFATPWPVTQLDYRAGVAVGIGALGLRAGWRTQVLDDRGVVDGEVHHDVFMGPYVGASFVF